MRPLEARLLRARWPLTAISFASMLVEDVGTFPGSVRHFRAMTAGIGIPDLVPFSSAASTHRLLELLGPTGRFEYGVLLGTFDVAFPLACALSVGAWLLTFEKRKLLWLPLLMLALDYAENALCAVLLATFPNEPAQVATVQGVVTALKFGAYAACLIVVVRTAAHARPRHAS